VKAWDQVFTKLMRRYKYLEKMLTEEMKKILVYLKGFSQVVMSTIPKRKHKRSDIEANYRNKTKKF
jgi:hypothetical protein